MPRKRTANATSTACGPDLLEPMPSVIVIAAPKLALGLLGQQDLCAPDYDFGSRWDVSDDVVVIRDRLIRADRMPSEAVGAHAQVNPRSALPSHNRRIFNEHALVSVAGRHLDSGVHAGQQAAVAGS